MKKRLLALLTALILLVSIPITASAATPRALSIVPGLSFSGTTASCTLTVMPSGSGDEISAVIKLWCGSTCLSTWTAEGNGYLFFCKQCVVEENKEYTLTADITINGTTEPTVSISKTCQ